MKLIYAANIRLPSAKAHVYQIMQMCEAFAEGGAQVKLLHASRHNLPELQDIEDVWTYYGVARIFEREKIPCADWFPLLRRLPDGARRFASLLVAWLQMATYTLALVRRVHPGDADVFFSRDGVPPAVLAALRPRLRNRLFYESHDFADTRIGLWLRRWLVRYVAGVIVTTPPIGRLFQEGLGLPAERLHVAPNGVRLERFANLEGQEFCRDELGLPADAFIVGYVGRLQLIGMSKGVDVLVQAVARLARDSSARPVRLCIVGGPDETVEEFRAQIAEYDLHENFIIAPGQVRPHDVPRWMRAFDVCALPSPGTAYFADYVLPLKLLEYMASGTPIVASDLPAITGVVRGDQNALLTTPDDPESLAEALRRLRDDLPLGERLAKQARQDVEQYTWCARAEGILAFIGERLV